MTLHHPFLHPYPESWPKPDPLRPQRLASRISEDQKVDLYNRRVTTRDLAGTLKVSEKWLSYTFPGKRPLENKASKRKARNAFREFHAKRVVAGEALISTAADAACCSYSTLRRVVLRLQGKVRLTDSPTAQEPNPGPAQPAPGAQP